MVDFMKERFLVIKRGNGKEDYCVLKGDYDNIEKFLKQYIVMDNNFNSIEIRKIDEVNDTIVIMSKISR